jgi:glycosyltransferase involved in cell wall biosynthesis
MDAEKSGLPPRLVLDVRLAHNGVHSGASRFVVGLASALVRELQKRRREASTLYSPSLTLVSQFDPASWIVDLVRRYPDVVSFWSGGKDALAIRRKDSPYAWSTDAVKRLKRYVPESFLWIAPGGIDRPDSSGCLFDKKNCGGVVQVIHDANAFEFPKSMGFFAGMRYRSRVKSTLNRYPFIMTISENAALSLRKLTKSKELAISALGEGVDAQFGANHRPQDVSEALFLRREFLVSAGLVFGGDLEREFVERPWVLGVGGFQSYKRWEDLEKALSFVRRTLPALLIRVDGSPEAAQRFASLGAERVGQCWYAREIGVLLVPALADDMLALLYRISDVLVYPNAAESYGLPALEAAVSGLPVLFRKSTTLETHFADGRLPEFFWRGVEGESEAEWSAALLEMLSPHKKRKEFFELMLKDSSPRSFVLKSAGREGAFEWDAVARAFLQSLQTLERANS